MDNFIECDTLQEANQVSLKEYVFLERFSVEKNKYCFKIRQRK